MTTSRQRASRCWRAPSRLLAACVAAGIVVAVPVGLAAARTKTAPPPAGVTLTGGCRGELRAQRPNGKVLDEATAPEPLAASTADPLDVPRGGSVDWAGVTPPHLSATSWWVHVDGIPVGSGTISNPTHATSAAGVLKVDSFFPSWLGVTGTYYLNGEVSGSGASCTGAVYVRFTGDPATGLLLWAGIVLVLAGIALLFGSRPNWLTTMRSVPTTSVTSTWAPTTGTAPLPPTPPSTRA